MTKNIAPKSFASYAAAQAWIKLHADAAGLGLRAFQSTASYRDAYPAIRAAYDAETDTANANAIACTKLAGFTHGQPVKVVVGHSLFGPIWRAATLDLSGAGPVATLDEPLYKPGAKRAVRTVKNPRLFQAD